MTTVTFHRIGEVEVNAEGRVVTVPIIRFAYDQDLREVISVAVANPGVAIPVPNTARVPQPRYKRVYGVQL